MIVRQGDGGRRSSTVRLWRRSQRDGCSGGLIASAVMVASEGVCVLGGF